MKPPADPRRRRILYALGLLSALKAAALLAAAEAVAVGIVSLINGDDRWQAAVWWGVAAAIGRGVLAWAEQATAARAALDAKERLRAELADRLVEAAGSGVPGGIGPATVLATRELDALDNYYTKYLPALVASATVPLLVGARILAADWVSAVVIVLTVPLVPVFMILIGQHTQERVRAASDSLARLSHHLVELARGLPVLIGLGRAEQQTRALRRVADNHRLTTMATLRVAFMSSLALELIATISVAVVAVFIGVRLLSGDMGLQTGLLVLILAPECYLPLRRLGTAHHASEDGLEALSRSRRILDAPRPRSLVSADDDGRWGGSGPRRIRVESLTVTYPDRDIPAVRSLTMTAAAGEITALAGRSGCGKSTVLGVLSGLLGDQPDGPRARGRITGIDPEAVAYVPQHPHTFAATVLDEVLLYGAAGEVEDEASDGGGTGASNGAGGGPGEAERLARACLASVHLGVDTHRDPETLSPGETRRLALARALMRIESGAADVLLVDEPTAHVDRATAARLDFVLAGLRARVTTILVAHSPDTLALADRVIRIDTGDGGANDSLNDAAVPETAVPETAIAETAVPETAVPETAIAETAVPGVAIPDGAVASEETRPSLGRTLRLLVTVLQPQRPRFVAAVGFGVLASLFAVSLTALSGWLIVRAAEQPPILYLLTAIVGVRFFGIGRSVCRYAEQLWLHDAIFSALTDLRVRVWESVCRRSGAMRRLLRGDHTLDHLVSDVDEVRDLAPRVVQPPVVAVLTAAGALVATAWLLPQALGIVLITAVVSLVVAPLLALWADRQAARGALALRSTVLRQLTQLLAAAADLRVNRADAGPRKRLRHLDERATAAARRSAWAQGLGDGVQACAGIVAAVAVLYVAAPGMADGTVTGEAVAVLVLMQLGLVDAYSGVIAAVQQWPTLRAVLGRFADDLNVPDADTGPADGGGGQRYEGQRYAGQRHEGQRHAGSRRAGSRRAGAPADGQGAERLRLLGLAARWPGQEAPVFSGVDADVGRGQWLAVTGPSGSGKSTLLAVLLGFLPPESGHAGLVGPNGATPASGTTGRVAWCPQQAHLFDSTLRANLLLARPKDAPPSRAEIDEAIAAVGLTDFVSELPDGLDTRIGSDGSRLSGGQRQRIAIVRALLTDADVVLLDEPTAHLDTETAEAMMTDLRRGLSDKIVVLVTHRAGDLDPSDIALDLGATARVPALAG